MSTYDEDDRLPAQNGDEEDAEGPDIQGLLDTGYTQLDGFVEWLERMLEMDTRTAQQDCFNAESFVDFLANNQRKSALDASEYDLRWFVFSHYIRKSIADRETQLRLPGSLLRFFQYLHAAFKMDHADWIAATLEDQQFFEQRLHDLQSLAGEDEAVWKSGFRDWCEEIEQDLDMRCLWLPNDMGEGMEWGEQMGWREATLRDDANRLWQSEREALLTEGLSFDAMRDHLVVSNLFWLDTPQKRLEDFSPRQTIRGERAEQRLLLESDDGASDDM